MRPWSDFMMWNHSFFLIELFIAYQRSDRVLFLLGTIMVILSPLYHQSYERHYQPYEQVAAVGTMIYVFFSSWYKMPLARFGIMCICFVVDYSLWQYSKFYDNKHYEQWHPWLHITIAATIHAYQCFI